MANHTVQLLFVQLLSRDTAVALDEALEPIDWSVTPDSIRRTWLDVPSGQLAAYEAGNPEHPRVVLVPGSTGSKEDFVRMMPLFVAEGYSVLSYDLAGQYESHGAGPENLEPPRRRFDLELFLEDFTAVLEQQSQPSHVLGYSFAGNLAQETYVRRPELFRTLTLLSAPPVPGLAFRDIKRVGWMAPFTPPALGAWFMMTGIKRNWIPVPDDRLTFVNQRFELTRRQSVVDTIAHMRNTPNHRHALRQAPLPKLVAVGEHDLWSREVHSEFAEAIGAEFVVYPTGHSPCEFTPHQLAWDMLELFKRAS